MRPSTQTAGGPRRAGEAFTYAHDLHQRLSEAARDAVGNADTIIGLDGKWPAALSVMNMDHGRQTRLFTDLFEIFIPTRGLELTEISGGLKRRSFRYLPGMVGFNSPGARWEIEWTGTIAGVCFFFDADTIAKAVEEVYGEQPDYLTWRLALSDHAPAIAYLGLDIASQIVNQFPAGRAHAERLMETFLALLIRRYSRSQTRNTSRVGLLSQQVLRALSFIEKNHHRAISLEEICRASHASPAHLNRLFRKEIGQSV